jgi:nucleoside-diphosphate-sugar epimerase
MGMAHVIPQLLDRTNRASASLDVYSVEHSRTFCYISDGVAMIKAAAEADACVGATLNVGTQSPEVTIRQLVDTILKLLNKPLEIVAKPATPGSPVRRCPDMSKTLALTGYESRVGLETGVELTYDWYKTRIFDGQQVTAN